MYRLFLIFDKIDYDKILQTGVELLKSSDKSEINKIINIYCNKLYDYEYRKETFENNIMYIDYGGFNQYLALIIDTV